jgi:hypothetical protein
MKEKNIDWLDIDFLRSIDQEVESHPSYTHYMSNVHRGIRHYRSTSEWWVPTSEFDDMDISDSQPTARENLIKSTVDELNSLLLKNDPVVRTHPYQPVKGDFSDDMDSILLAAWRNAKTRHHFRSMQKMSAIAGLGVCKTGWNTANKNIHPEGEVGIQFISPTDILLDPYASNAHRGLDVRYIRHTSWQTPEAIISRYGHEGATALNLEPEKGRHRQWGQSLQKIRKKLIDTITGETSEGDRVDRRIPVYEYWVFPVHGRESELVTGEMVDEKEYPYGIVVTRVNDKIVRQIANPYYEKKPMKMGKGLNAKSPTIEVGHRMHPFVILYWVREMNANGYNGIYDCTGMVQEQIPIQQSVNSVGRNLEQHVRTTANPGMYYFEDALDMPADRIERRPGEMVPINSKFGTRAIGDVVKDFSGQQMSPEVFNYWQHKRQQVGLVAGLKPHMVGLAPQGTSHTPAATVGTLQEASFSAMWSPNDEITAACADIAYRYLGLIQQFYAPGRIVQISEEGGTASYVEIQSNHLAAMFRLEVVSGTTTPLYDMDKETKLMGISQKVDAALASQSPTIMKSCLIYLDNLNNPHTYQWVQLLKQSIAEIEQAQQTLAGMGGMALQQSQKSLPPAQGEPGLEDLAAALGTSPEELERALSS